MMHEFESCLSHRAAECDMPFVPSTVLHCAGHFGTKFNDILDHNGYHIQATDKITPEFCDVKVVVEGTQDESVPLLFQMQVKDVGRNKGCFMTACLSRRNHESDSEGEEGA